MQTTKKRLRVEKYFGADSRLMSRLSLWELMSLYKGSMVKRKVVCDEDVEFNYQQYKLNKNVRRALNARLEKIEKHRRAAARKNQARYLAVKNANIKSR